MDKKIVITKIGDTPPPPKEGGRKTVKTFPRGILKRTSKLHLKGVTDPAKSPPLKKGMKKHTLRLLTEKGMKKYRKTMKNRIAKMSDAKVKQTVQTAGLVTNPNTPPEISRQILDNAISAGFISS
jgi:hypothetical protein